MVTLAMIDSFVNTPGISRGVWFILRQLCGMLI
jgi:hypothetical protein